MHPTLPWQQLWMQGAYLGCAVASHVGKDAVELAGLQVSLEPLNELMHHLQQAGALLQGPPVGHKGPLAPENEPPLQLLQVVLP